MTFKEPKQVLTVELDKSLNEFQEISKNSYPTPIKQIFVI